MKLLKLVLAVALMLLIMPQAMAYTIDGKLDDWGITPSELDDGLNNNNVSAWIPEIATVDWIVENDVYAGYTGYDHGVHVKGIGSTYSSYVEPKVHLVSNPSTEVAEPYAGEYYDVEAMYFDDDECFAYFAIVISDPNCVGDLDFVVDGVEYGVVLKPHWIGTHYAESGEIYKNPTWEPSDYIIENNKTLITGGTLLSGKAEVAILNMTEEFGVSDGGAPTYCIELRIYKPYIGFPENCTWSHVYYAATCGNDHIENEVHYDYPSVSEFLTVLIPAGIILGFVYLHRKRNEN